MAWVEAKYFGFNFVGGIGSRLCRKGMKHPMHV